MPSTALKEHEYEIAKLIKMDKCLLQIVLVSKEGSKHGINPKKSREDPESYRSVHMEFTLSNLV